MIHELLSAVHSEKDCWMPWHLVIIVHQTPHLRVSSKFLMGGAHFFVPFSPRWRRSQMEGGDLQKFSPWSQNIPPKLNLGVSSIKYSWGTGSGRKMGTSAGWGGWTKFLPTGGPPPQERTLNLWIHPLQSFTICRKSLNLDQLPSAQFNPNPEWVTMGKVWKKSPKRGRKPVEKNHGPWTSTCSVAWCPCLWLKELTPDIDPTAVGVTRF